MELALGGGRVSVYKKRQKMVEEEKVSISISIMLDPYINDGKRRMGKLNAGVSWSTAYPSRLET